MFSRLTYIANVCQFGAAVHEVFLERVIFFPVIFGVLSRMLFVPYPLMNLPRQNGRNNRICVIWGRLECFESRDNNFFPKLFCGRESEINVYDSFHAGISREIVLSLTW